MKSIKELKDEIKVLSNIKDDLKENKINRTFTNEDSGIQFNYQDFLNEKIHMKKGQLGLAKAIKKRKDKKLEGLHINAQPVKEIHADNEKDFINKANKELNGKDKD